jgi:hypothetical protein
MQETDRSVLVMWDCLQRAGGAARFVPLVLNHDSFAQTVENIFTLSFLVRGSDASGGRTASPAAQAQPPGGVPAARGGAGGCSSNSLYHCCCVITPSHPWLSDSTPLLPNSFSPVSNRSATAA